MHKIAEKISSWMIQNGADAKLHDEYTYGIEGGISTSLLIIILLTISIILKCVPDMLMYIAVWLPMRFLAGGVHAKGHLACTIISVAIGVVSTHFPTYINSIPIYATIATIAVCYVTLFIIAPVIHKHHPVSKGHMLKMRRIGRVTEAVIGVGIVAMQLAKWHVFAATFAAYVNVTILAIIGYFNKNTIKHYD